MPPVQTVGGQQRDNRGRDSTVYRMGFSLEGGLGGKAHVRVCVCVARGRGRDLFGRGRVLFRHSVRPPLCVPRRSRVAVPSAFHVQKQQKKKGKRN